MTKQKETIMKWIYREHHGSKVIGGTYLQETEDSFYVYECSECHHIEKVDTPHRLPKTCSSCGAMEYYKEKKRSKFG